MTTSAKPRQSKRPRLRQRRAIHDALGLGERLADAIAAGMGSWNFIIIQTVIVTVWVIANMITNKGWDPYPFILLNLLFSTQAAYAAPMILMSSNRQAAKDRKRDDLEADEVDTMFALNRQQVQLLQGQDEILVLLKRVAERQLAESEEG